MHEMFKYDRVKESLFRSSYSWERAITVLENLINIPEIVLAYPINLYGNRQGSTSVYFFTRNYIYHIYQSETKEFQIIVLKSENISEMSLSINDESNVSLKIVLKNENIVLTSHDAPNDYNSYKYAEAIVEIAAIFSK